MEKINLYKILEKDEELFQDVIDGKLSYTLAKSFIYGWMKEACETTVDLCAENAEIKDIKIDYTGIRSGGYYIIKEVNKESIFKVKKLIV